ncbi:MULTISPECIES: restriction endonuclease subunit S [Streptomyces]|uniref:restriction endonuclease subunit S n=1 Tax=Streptomyces TaxID=1883 RepID=UPI000996870B|nr:MULTISPECIES: restriction endonuclease subunit S [Streptomyces]WTD30300.1 restriction endonuclease subunit S [Streptomyces anulatus]
MGGLPEGWVWARLGDVAQWGSGGTPKAKAPDYYGGTIPWAVIGDMDDGVLRETAQTITDAGLAASAAKWIPEGAILIAMYGSIGKLAIAGIPITSNQAIAHAVPFCEMLDAKYLFWYLRSQRERLISSGKGGTQQNISQSVLKQWPIPLPPLAEQHRIVEALEEQISRLDAAAGGVGAALRRSEALKKVLDNRAVVDHEGDAGEASQPLTVDEVRSSTKKLSGRKWKPTDPIGIPGFAAAGRWPTVSLGDISRNRGYGTSVKCSYEGSGPPVLRIPNIQSGSIDPQDMKFAEESIDLSDYFLRPGDVLFVRTNGSPSLIGRVGVVDESADVAFASYLIRFRLNLSVVDPRWVRLVTQSSIWRRHIETVAASSAGQFNLNASRLAEIPIPLPSLSEQRVIVEQADTRATEAQRMGGALRRCELRGRQLRAKLLRRAFNGYLVPQDPSDEPAATLLARVAAERDTAKRTARPRKVTTAAAVTKAAPAPTPVPSASVQQELFVQ